jgi:hypothetical protein
MKSKTKKEESKNLPPRIIIKFQDAINLPYTSDEEIQKYLLEKNIIPVKKFFEKYPGITISRLFTSVEPETINKSVSKAKELNPDYKYPNFLTYCSIDCPHEINADELLQELRKNKNVEYAYIESDPAPPPYVITGTNPEITNQGYLDPAPKGINARYAWTKNGGCGEGKVQFIDIEYAWILDHEDISSSGVEFLWGDENRVLYRDHGTSVLGVILMQDNILGGLGITPKVKAKVVSQISPAHHNSIHNAIVHAIPNLNPGDILLIEAQVFDTRQTNILRPVEIEEAIFRVIELATNNGIIVIEAAGNGDGRRGYNLDEFTDENGKKILDRDSNDFKDRDSGAIMVAAASALVRNGRHGKRRTSNYGNRIDCYGWGSHVFTADDPAKEIYLPEPPSTEAKPPYTEDFSGTSSASAIIAGAAIAVQSIVEADGRRRLGPIEMRDILKTNGTPSRNAIGVMPDLYKIIHDVLGLRP